MKQLKLQYHTLPNFLCADICKKCGATAFVVFDLLLSHRDNTTGNCSPSISTLHKESKLCQSTITKVIKALNENNFIAYEKGGPQKAQEKEDIGSNTSNKYYFPCLDFSKS